jgi:uncharacterized surface protein with fasciclin (FAS1) repeats
MRTPFNRRLAPIAAVGVSAALVLAACGSDSDDSTPATSAAAATTAAPAPTMAPATPTAAEATGTIVDVAAGNADFSTLVAAVKAAGLDTTLAGPGPFTVFAPTNEAFAALPAGTVDTLLKPENKQELAAILTYHVVPARVMAADVAPGTVTTVNGGDLTVSTDGGNVMLTDARGNQATVVKTDILGSNGVIHVIDAVLLPAEG